MARTGPAIEHRGTLPLPMRIPLLLLPLILVALTASADETEYYGPYRFEPGSTQTVFSDTAYIRSAPVAGAGAIDSLYAFEPLKIVKQMTEQLTLGRKTAPWYQVSFQRAGSPKLGYLWGGALALKAIRHQGAQFAGGLLSYPDPAAFSSDDSGADLRMMNTFSIKAKSGTVRDECRFNILRESGYFYEQTDSNGVVTDKHWETAKGVPPGASFLVHFGMSGEACGIPSYTITAAWNGSALIRLPMLQSNADGGEWAYEEAYIFPAQKGGKPGLLRIRANEMTAIENSEAMKSEYKWRSYRYNATERRFEPIPD